MVQAFILCEILARIVKNEIRALLRETMKDIRKPMEARSFFFFFFFFLNYFTHSFFVFVCFVYLFLFFFFFFFVLFAFISYRNAIVQYLNLVLIDKTPQSTRYWETDVKVNQQQ